MHEAQFGRESRADIYDHEPPASVTRKRAFVAPAITLGLLDDR